MGCVSLTRKVFSINLGYFNIPQSLSGLANDTNLRTILPFIFQGRNKKRTSVMCIANIVTIKNLRLSQIPGKFCTTNVILYGISRDPDNQKKKCAIFGF